MFNLIGSLITCFWVITFQVPILLWKWRVVMMPTLLSLAAPQVAIMTTCGATSDNKVGIMTTLGFNVHIWDPYLVKTLYADVPAPGSTRASAATNKYKFDSHKWYHIFLQSQNCFSWRNEQTWLWFGLRRMCQLNDAIRSNFLEMSRLTVISAENIGHENCGKGRCILVCIYSQVPL